MIGQYERYFALVDKTWIEGLTEQENLVYRAIEKWVTRLNHWEYMKQVRKNQGRRIKSFSPNAVSHMLLETRDAMCKHERTAEEVMNLLHEPSIRTELNLCMEAGF